MLSVSCTEPSGTKKKLHTRWIIAQQGDSRARPAIQGDVVFFGTGDGQIVARDVGSGSTRWSSNVAGGAVVGGRMVVRNGVVVVSQLVTTVGLNAIDGGVLWFYSAPKDTVGGGTLPGQVLANRIDADSEMVFIPAWGASVNALDLKTGALRWVWQPGRTATDTASSGVFRSGASGVRVSGDTVYALVWHFLAPLGVPAEAWVVALDRLTGTELWRVTLPCYWSAACVEGAPAVYGHLVIVNQGAHEYAIDARTQTVAWDFPTTPIDTPVSESELFGDIVYHDGGDHNIYALHATDGSLVWKAPIGGSASRDLLVTDQRVIFPDGVTMHVLDRATGARVATAEIPGGLESVVSSPGIARGNQVFITLYGAAWSFDEP